jgi:hypothetical protein
MNAMDQWDLINQTGYTFVFEWMKNPSVEVKVFASNEQKAWSLLQEICGGGKGHAHIR